MNARQNLEQQLRVITQLSQTMLAQAQAGDWAQLAALDIERRKRLDGLFGTPAAAAQLAHLTRDLQHVLELDRAILAMVTGARTQLAADIQTVARGKRATQAYAGI